MTAESFRQVEQVNDLLEHFGAKPRCLSLAAQPLRRDLYATSCQERSSTSSGTTRFYSGTSRPPRWLRTR